MWSNLLFHLHTKETTASGGVGQQFLLVASADEGSDSWQLAVIAMVRLPEGQLAELHQVLQRRHGADAVSVELVHVDKSEEGEFLLASAHAGDVELIDVETLWFRG